MNRHDATTLVRNSLDWFDTGGSRYVIPLQEFGTYKGGRIAENILDGYGILRGQADDPFCAAGISNFDPFEFMVSVLMASDSSRSDTIRRHLAYFHVLESEQRQFAEDHNRTIRIGDRELDEAWFIQQRYTELIHWIKVPYGPIGSLISATFMSDPLDPVTYRMLALGRVSDLNDDAGLYAYVFKFINAYHDEQLDWCEWQDYVTQFARANQ